MSESPYDIPLEELVDSARVDEEDLVEEHDVTPPSDPNAFEKYRWIGMGRPVGRPSE